MMIDERSTLNITGGMDVYGSDDEKVGSVADVQGDYVVVSKGFFFPTDYYVPLSAINTVSEDRVYLSVTKDNALNQGWDSIPASTTETSFNRGNADDTGTTAGAVADDTYVDTASTDAARDTWSGTAAPDEPFDHDANPDEIHRDEAETIQVPLSEEELTAEKRTVDRGAVQIDKHVVEEEQTLDVPVSEEHVNVARRVVDRDLQPGETAFEGGTIEIPVQGEDVDVQKRAHVREELEISKDQTTETRQVSGTVRREEAQVRDATGTDLQDTDATATGKRSQKRR